MRHEAIQTLWQTEREPAQTPLTSAGTMCFFTNTRISLGWFYLLLYFAALHLLCTELQVRKVHVLLSRSVTENWNYLPFLSFFPNCFSDQTQTQKRSTLLFSFLIFKDGYRLTVLDFLNPNSCVFMLWKSLNLSVSWSKCFILQVTWDFHKILTRLAEIVRSLHHTP